jgi:3-methyladenine DNA glycosylase/8-oxoguanine DNA glycosylase
MTRQRADLAAAQAALSGVDPVLDELIERHGPARLPSPTPGHRRFEELVESIAYQQLHGNAAAAIWGRVVVACGGTVSPETLLATGFDDLRSCGLSGAKVRSMLDLATRADAGELRLSRIGRLDDEAVIAELVPAWGVGRWTAQMFLIFTLGRLDVWPAGDFGVRNGYGRAWGHTEMPTEKQMPDLGARFSGARSLVAWYCWRAADSSESGRT